MALTDEEEMELRAELDRLRSERAPDPGPTVEQIEAAAAAQVAVIEAQAEAETTVMETAAEIRADETEPESETESEGAEPEPEPGLMPEPDHWYFRNLGRRS